MYKKPNLAIYTCLIRHLSANLLLSLTDWLHYKYKKKTNKLLCKFKLHEIRYQ